MASLLFYSDIVPLNSERHADLRLRDAVGDCSFARDTHFVPVAGVEFYQVAADYPILFAGSDEDPSPVALLGLESGRNLFVDSEGHWQSGTYVPAFVRRYPFVLARGEDGEDADMTVCIDQAYGGFNREEGTALFEDDGSQSEFLQRTVGFLQQYLADSERTRTFARRLNELGLLVRRDLQITDADGNSRAIRDFRVVDEAALDQLDDATVAELHRDGSLGWIHAHMVSRGQLERMPVRLRTEAA
ncbi:SapC family protein [Arhodomonas aquaeolei]|uniref:SapC family protein n=1 Tax=Arhodomonas aquaeolei TaxID=2369 RepID=UPI00035D1B30|nr:SapC family protein [Arhodomonas aquaeolei]MCS4503848.1 SapC family protein [Arhodomonas aquaeolei]